MANAKQELGKFSEQSAKIHYLNRGYTLIAQNFRCRGGEIDLIFEVGTTLVIVEVRSLKNDEYFSLESGITLKKRRRIERATRYFIYKNKGHWKSLRFDFWARVGEGAPRVIENAW